MNTAKTKEFVEKNGIVVVRADKTQTSPHVDEFLGELGNTGGTIPFYAIYPAGGGKPVTLDGILTQGKLIKALEQAGPSKVGGKSETAMR